MIEAEQVLAGHPETAQRIERALELLDGFESPYGAELLATVHWVTTREDAVSDEDVVARTYAWDDRKQKFSRRQILLARRVLEERGWLARGDIE